MLDVAPPQRGQDVTLVGEFWHAKGIIVEELFKQLYTNASVGEPGTLGHLVKLLDYKDSFGDVKHHRNEADAFLQVAGDGHICAAFMTFTGMATFDSPLPFDPTKTDLQEMLQTFVTQFLTGDDSRLSAAAAATASVADGEQQSSDSSTSTAAAASAGDDEQSPEPDCIRRYASNFTSIMLLLREFDDAIHEGDGERLMRLQKVYLSAVP